MTRCKSCLTRADAMMDICPVCGIDQDKARKDLTAQEKKIRNAARNIRFVAMLHLTGAGISIMQLPEAQQPILLALFAVLNLVLAIGLIRYAYSTYKLAVVCYFALGIVNIISVQVYAIPVVLLLLYAVGNGHAKAIFERRLPDPG